jgi:hypothetical protein
MLRSIPETVRRFRQHLTRLDDQPLGMAALVVIVFLDLFILGAIFDGLANHTRQLDSPDEIISPLCREVVIEADWNPTNRVALLAQLVTRYRLAEFAPDARAGAVTKHALCAPIVSAYQAVRDDDALAQQLEQLTRLAAETRDLRAAAAQTKGAYDTSLLERIAGQQDSRSKVAAIQKESAEWTARLEDLVQKQRLLAAAIEQNARVQTLFSRVAAITEADRTALREELRRLNFWYPARRLGMEMLFLLPLLGVFYFWNARSIAAGRPFQTLVSSHLLVVAAIPVVLKLGELVYDIIPRKLLRQIIELLESLKLVAIWHYLVIGTAIAAALALIYLFQKKLFSPERLLQRRIARGLCQACGQHLPAGSRHCPACGAAQFRPCPSCGEPMHVHGRHCMACGHEA